MAQDLLRSDFHKKFMVSVSGAKTYFRILIWCIVEICTMIFLANHELPTCSTTTTTACDNANPQHRVQLDRDLAFLFSGSATNSDAMISVGKILIDGRRHKQSPTKLVFHKAWKGRFSSKEVQGGMF